eukprot:CAMPEP_0119307814 /NCGR_PEP_ID=MMETSP1333-20130426/8201_1 /TAXON_ID=418940 /ORGANISM="Scyphosphaera apsteinii, Strain RCC1455" /LENGTH=183 /DNA_ID=CAMNT_0007311443 /DNA_START=18 /DNA_END=569 /DNA_ORIENTATION=-
MLALCHVMLLIQGSITPSPRSSLRNQVLDDKNQNQNKSKLSYYSYQAAKWGFRAVTTASVGMSLPVVLGMGSWANAFKPPLAGKELALARQAALLDHGAQLVLFPFVQFLIEQKPNTIPPVVRKCAYVAGCGGLTFLMGVMIYGLKPLGMQLGDSGVTFFFGFGGFVTFITAMGVLFDEEGKS